jgi:hypothetical protein
MFLDDLLAGVYRAEPPTAPFSWTLREGIPG